MFEEYSEKVKHDADKLLETSDLLSHLNEFGEVFICGGCKYDLMWDPDIDIVVVCDDPRGKSVEALKKLIGLRLFQKYEYGDFVNYKCENCLESYLISLVLPFRDNKWEIEVRFFDEYPIRQKEMDELVLKKLDDKKKKTILGMKNARCESGLDKHVISSTDIYKKVLADGIDNYERLVN